MRRTRAARRCWNTATPKRSALAKSDKEIIAEYERGARWAGWAFVGMFVFLTVGVVMFGW